MPDEIVKEEEEVVDDSEKESGNEPEPEAVDINKMAGLDLDVEFHEEEKKEPEEEVKEEVKKPEKKEAKPPEPSPKEKDWEDRLTRLERDKKDLQKALHEARQERKAKKEPEAVLTDAELMKIVEEHKDDPKVMFNAVAYKMQQAMKTGKAEAVNEIEIKGKQNELNSILRTRIKDFENEASEPRVIIGKAKTDFNLDEHPFGDFLAAAAAVYIDLPNIAKGWMEEGKKQALNGKADENRKEGIKKSQPSGGGPKIPAGKVESDLTPQQMETARKLGKDKDAKWLRVYKTQILKSTNA